MKVKKYAEKKPSVRLQKTRYKLKLKALLNDHFSAKLKPTKNA